MSSRPAAAKSPAHRAGFCRSPVLTGPEEPFKLLPVVFFVVFEGVVGLDGFSGLPGTSGFSGVSGGVEGFSGTGVCFASLGIVRTW